MEKAGGIVAPEDLVAAGDRFSGQHLPLAAVVADGGVPGGGDLLAPASAVLHGGRTIAAAQQLGVALGFQGGVGGSADDAIVGGVHLEACFELPGFGCVEPIGTAGGLPVPVGIEVPEVEEVVGVVAPEDLVAAGDGVSGQHLPLAAVAADGGVPGGGDLLAGATDFHEGFAIAALEQLGVALTFNGGVIIDWRWRGWWIGTGKRRF